MSTIRIFPLARAALLLAGICTAPAAWSQASWETSLTLYGQAASMSGVTTVGDTRADVDVSFDELLDHLDAAGMMVLRSQQERWAISLNGFYAGVGGTANDAASGVHFDVDLTQTLVELRASLRLNEQVELLGGARYQSVDAEITATAASGAAIARDRTQDWTDVIVGARAAIPLGRSWTLIGAADVGGFGLTSDLTWSATLAADWSVSRNIGVVFGYRALDTDYEDGTGAGLFGYDVLVAGPLAGVRFNF